MGANISIGDIVGYSVRLGGDPNLVQGAGGNVSWKDGDTLWIKASGTWLNQAEQQDIFVPLRYSAAREQAESGAGNYASCVIGDSDLRPSIETALHALLPQTVVVHCHAIDVIAHSVVRDGKERLRSLLDGINWVWVDYVKPGAELAAAVHERLKQHNGEAPDVIVLGNHGLVIAGADVPSVDALLQDVLRRMAIVPSDLTSKPVDARVEALWEKVGYEPSNIPVIQQLAVRDDLLSFVREKWVLYPDHAVFLDGAAAIFEDTGSPQEFLSEYEKPPVCVFVPGVDVMVSTSANAGQRAMIQCYADVVHRLPNRADVVGLSHEQVAELLNWDAEKYRQQLNAKK